MPNFSKVVKFLLGPSKPIIICEDPKFIYFRNSRTASTSLYRHILQSRLKLKMLNSKENPKTYLYWVYGLTESKWNEYFKFGGVRNPWDRAVSIYHYIVKDRYNVPFSKWATNITKYDNDRNLYDHRNPCTNHTHFEGEQVPDFLYRYESINEDFKHIADKLGIKIDKLPHRSKTCHKPYREYYDKKSKAAIAAIFKNDIELLDYSF